MSTKAVAVCVCAEILNQCNARCARAGSLLAFDAEPANQQFILSRRDLNVET